MHRPFDGAFPPNYPAELAIRQCTEVAQRLVEQPSKAARNRAYTMLLMAEDGLHSFDYEVGRQVYADLEEAELDDDAKRTVILELHSDENVGQLFLQRCRIRTRWLTANEARSLSRVIRHYDFSPAFTANEARSLSRVIRHYDFSPAFTRNVLEHLGPQPRHLLHDRSRLPDTGTIRRRESAVHPIAAKSRVQRRDHRERLVDVGRPARRTPPAQTK